MNWNRRTTDKLSSVATAVITEGIRIKGTIDGTDNIIIYGEIEGNIEVSGTVLVGKTGKIHGEVKAMNLILEGYLEGFIQATEKVEIRAGGKCKGDLITATIAVCENAYFDGNVKMEVEEKEAKVFHFKEKRGFEHKG